MEYGFIVMKQNELFFVYNVEEDNVVLIPSYDPNVKIRDIQENYTIVYKPKLRGVCELNNLYLNNDVIVHYSDKQREGKIVKKNKDMIHIFFPKENVTEVMDFNYKGFPSKITNIDPYVKPKDKEQTKTPFGEEKGEEYEAEAQAEEEEDSTYYYSIEQQVNQLLEDMTKNMGSRDNLNEINKIITHYIELNKKYFTYDNNYIFKKLNEKPIYNHILNGHSIFQYYTNHLKSYYYHDEQFIPNSLKDKELIKKIFENGDNPNIHFFDNADQFTLNTNDNPIATYLEMKQVNEDNIDNLYAESSTKKSTYNRGHYTNILLEDMNNDDLHNIYHSNLYSIKSNKEFIIDGIIVPSISKLKHYMSQHNLMNKTKETHYEKDYYEIGQLKDDPCIFTQYNQIIKKDTSKEFYTFLNRILPNTRYLLKCLDIQYYNMYDYIKILSIFDIYELSKLDYDYIQRLVAANIRDYKKIDVQKLKQTEYKTNSFILNSLSNPYDKDHFYSSSELFHMSLYENHILLLFDLIKANLKDKMDVNKNSAKDMVDDIKQNNNIDHTIYYDKVYNSMNDLNADTIPIFKDVNSMGKSITNVNEPIVKSTTLLWDKITDKSNFNHFEDFERKLKDGTHGLNLDDWYPNHTITNGSYGYVKETQQTFVYENDIWVLYTEKDLVKGSKTMNSYVNKRSNELVKANNTNQLIMKQEYSEQNRPRYVEKSKYFSSSMNTFMKYNLTKRMYSQKYSLNDYKPSPYQPMFDKILMIENAEERKKSIKIFCELYTTEGKDPYWLYCIESNAKLVPLFIKTLAYTNNYNETIQQICFEQGTQQDEYWVDKHSGYTIKKINFNEEEGFTSDGFKVVSREVLTETNVMDSEIKKEIETILNAIGISNSYVKPIYNEYVKIRKQISKSSMLLYVVIFIYIQAHVYTSEITTSFASCKTSFDGYPLSKDEKETKGIDYMICIYKALKNIKKEVSQSDFIKLIKNALKYSPKISYQLTIVKKSTLKKETHKSWSLFLPRLNDIKITKLHNDYYKSFYFQQSMNKWVSNIEPHIKLPNGSYKVINNYIQDKSINEIIQKYKEHLKFLSPNLFYYAHPTKNENKFKVSETTYSLEKIKHIMDDDSYTEVSDELMKQVRQTLHSKKQIIDIKPRIQVKEDIPLPNIKQYKKDIEEYLNTNAQLKLNKLFIKLDAKSKKRLHIVTSDDEQLKTSHSILFNLLSEIKMMSKMTSDQTYQEPKLRSYLESILKPSDKIKLKDIIHNSISLLEKKEIKDYNMDLSFPLKEQIIIYKYYLCDLYKTSTSKERSTYEDRIHILLKKLIVKLDVIKKNNEQAKYIEKKEITDRFKEMSDESRSVEFMLKQSKLGDWSLGLSKSIYKYSKEEQEGEPINEEMDTLEEITEYEEYMDEEE